MGGSLLQSYIFRACAFSCLYTRPPSMILSSIQIGEPYQSAAVNEQVPSHLGFMVIDQERGHRGCTGFCWGCSPRTRLTSLTRHQRVILSVKNTLDKWHPSPVSSLLARIAGSRIAGRGQQPASLRKLLLSTCLLFGSLRASVSSCAGPFLECMRPAET